MQTQVTPPAWRRDFFGDQSQCIACRRVFQTYSGLKAHRIGGWSRAGRCFTAEEIAESFWQRKDGIHREKVREKEVTRKV